jgi:hypothetical protein
MESFGLRVVHLSCQESGVRSSVFFLMRSALQVEHRLISFQVNSFLQYIQRTHVI